MRVRGAPPGEWQHPDDNPPPKGEMLWLLTEYGVAIKGIWQVGMIAWMHAIKLQPEMKARLRAEGKLK